MTDASIPIGSAAADLLSVPATPADQARERIATLKADPDFVRRHLAGDHETRSELARLHELAYAPSEGSIAFGGPTPEAQRAEMADHFAAVSDLPPAVIDQIKRGDPVSAGEFRLAVGRRNALMADPAWVARYMNGDASARRDMTLLNVILSSRIRMEG